MTELDPISTLVDKVTAADNYNRTKLQVLPKTVEQFYSLTPELQFSKAFDIDSVLCGTKQDFPASFSARLDDKRRDYLSSLYPDIDHDILSRISFNYSRHNCDLNLTVFTTGNTETVSQLLATYRENQSEGYFVARSKVILLHNIFSLDGHLQECKSDTLKPAFLSQSLMRYWGEIGIRRLEPVFKSYGFFD